MTNSHPDQYPVSHTVHTTLGTRLPGDKLSTVLCYCSGRRLGDGSTDVRWRHLCVVLISVMMMMGVKQTQQLQLQPQPNYFPVPGSQRFAQFLSRRQEVCPSPPIWPEVRPSPPRWPEVRPSPPQMAVGSPKSAPDGWKFAQVRPGGRRFVQFQSKRSEVAQLRSKRSEVNQFLASEVGKRGKRK